MRIQLEQHEKQSPLWLRLKEYLESQLATLRATNDHPDLGADKTAFVRGQIKMVKAMLDLEKDPPSIPGDRGRQA